MSEIILTGSGYSEPVSFIGLYSDGTPMVKTDQFEDIVAHADTMVLRPKSLNDFVVAMFLVDAIRYAGGRIEKLVLPYIPGARQDRSNPTGDVLFTLDGVARMINERKFSRVVVLDPHSPVSYRLISNIRVYPLGEIGRKITKFTYRDGRYDGIIVPDRGAEARAQMIANAMSLPVFYGGKTRDVSTGRLSGFTLESIPQGHYLVADDICDGGGTFIGLGEKIAEQGATADLYVTHGIFAKGTTELKKHYRNIYTTDSRDINERNDVTIIPVVSEMRNYG
jgi:ribose-phosphate pyrophosphokinase